MIQERHSPVMISENVPFQDMEDQWAEVEAGWGVPAYVHNSAANAHTHRNRAWWITQGNTEKPLWPTAEMLQAFGPRDVEECLEPGHTLDQDSCATCTASWNRGTDDKPDKLITRLLLHITNVM